MLRNPANEGVLRYLQAKGRGEEERPPRPQNADYWESGSHPDVVERVWDQLGASLPPEARRVIFGSPVLLVPTSRLIVAVAIGTQYAVRVPPSVQPSKPQTETVWAGGERMDIRAAFGPDWIFGSYAGEEENWPVRFLHEIGL